MAERLKVAVLGASGYTGIELLRLLAHHPGVEIAALTADRHAGKSLVEVFPHVLPQRLPTLVKIDQVDWSDIQVAFCGLPHATTQEVVSGLPRSVKVGDLSADFRLYDVETYAERYGQAHHAPPRQKEAVYGMTGKIGRPQGRERRWAAG